DVLVDRPALQSAEVLVKLLVFLGQELKTAVFAPVARGGAADHLPPDAPGSEFQAIHDLGLHPAVEPGDACALAARTGTALNLDLLVWRQFRPLPPPAVPHACPPDHLARAEKDLLPLVVEVRTVVDVFKLLEGELRTAPFRTARWGDNLVRPGDGVGCRGSSRPFAPPSCHLTYCLDALGHPLQGGTVVRVVGDKFLLPTRVVGLLPACPPHHALEAGDVLIRPSTAQVSPDLLQPVGERGEVQTWMDRGQGVDGVSEDPIDELLPLHDLPHPL